jgi:hypothetical protein
MGTGPVKRVGGASAAAAAQGELQKEKNKIDALRNRIPFNTALEPSAKKHKFSTKLPPPGAKVNDRLAAPLKRALSRAA